jgi:ubiquinone/menaquinone biosynthesis C-methylase UbiE
MSPPTESGSSLPPEIDSHYAAGLEAGRLASGSGRLELARTQEIVRRFLPPLPAVVADVGGGPGVYACWLAGLGYEVHLYDPVPLHVAQAEAASRAQPTHPLASFAVGDALALGRPDESTDVVLLLGPLYHLTVRADRLTALKEARRVLRPSGTLVAAAISRFASALDGLRSGYLDDPAFAAIALRDLVDGQHRNPTGHPAYFTTAFFHHPGELRQEVQDAGFTGVQLLAVEGPGCSRTSTRTGMTRAGGSASSTSFVGWRPTRRSWALAPICWPSHGSDALPGRSQHDR